MQNLNLEKYEYKAPSYQLVEREKRDASVLHQHRSKRRYFYDARRRVHVSNAGEKEAVSLLFAGDLLCQEKMIRRMEKVDGGYDFSLCFEYIRPLLQSADFVCGNLETPISHTAPYRGEIFTHEGPFYCNAPVQYLEALSYAGFDMLTTENNHTLDAGVRGLMETVENMEQFGFIHTGTCAQPEDKFAVVDVCGFQIGFAAFGMQYNTMEDNLTPEGKSVLLNTYSRDRAEQIFRSLKERGAEFVVCFPHWGKEYTQVLSAEQKQMAEELTQIGYDFVVGSHSHVVQKFGFVNGKPVAFSLGNLMAHLNVGSKKNEELTVLIDLELIRNEKGAVIPEIKFIPCKILRNYHKIPFVVLPVNEDLRLTKDSEPKLKLTINALHDCLGCKMSRFEKAFVIGEQQKRDFEEARLTLQSRAAALRPYEPVKIPDISAEELPKKPLLAHFQRYYRNQYGLYEIYADHAELVELERTAETVRLPNIVEGVPVTVVFGSKNGNERSRLVYLGMFAVTVEKAAFKNFTNMESVRIFDALEEIKESAFENCRKMTGVNLPRSLKRIGACAFMNCEGLRSIKIPPNVTSIGEDAFEGCPSLTIYCEEGSEAARYAERNGIAVKYMPLSGVPVAAVDTGIAEKKEVVQVQPVVAAGSAGVVMGPMNGPEDKHPAPIIAACFYLGKPLPASAKCGKQPSHYIGKNAISGKLSVIKKRLGDRLPEIESEELEKRFRVFRNAYKGQAKLAYTETDLAVYFADWLIHANPRGFNCTDYFVFEFYNKEPSVRETFMGNSRTGFRQRVFKACNQDPKRHCLRLKSKFNQTFAKYVNRDWVDATTCTFEEFAAFLEKHEKFFVKPVGGTGGVGARVIERCSDTPEKLYQLCKTEELIVEELVKQHKDLAEFNASTLNTIRVNTLLCADGIPRVTLTFARFGRAGNDADNFHAGGVGGVVDIDTGVMITDAINQDQLRVTHHPDSHKQFLGFQYPHWQDIKAAVCDAALMLPQVRHIGWDVAVTDKGTVELIEGNSRPNFDGLQAPDQLGRLFRYKKYIEEIEAMNGKHYTEMEPLVIDITGMELDR